jgi:hypothetical protein
MEPIPITAIQSHRFMHGLPVEADVPTDWCFTSYPSLLCTCGVCRLTWSYTPAGGTPLSQVATFVRGRVFLHAAVPQDGSGPLCQTTPPRSLCGCGTYTIVWEDVETPMDAPVS